MLPYNINSITELAVLKLCEDSYSESKTLDFKRTLPGNSDKDKHELQKDVCAFANSDGGDLVYGVLESNGVASRVVPIATESHDDAIRRIFQILDAGIEPRIPNLRVEPVNVEGGYVLILRVSASYNGPHSFWVNNSRRFVMRNGTGTVDMSFDQLRRAFDRTATLADKTSALISARIEKAVEGRTPKHMRPGALCAFYAFPISGVAGQQSVDIESLHKSGYARFVQGGGGYRRSFNLDGIIIYPSGLANEGYYTCTQIFRGGGIEALYSASVESISREMIVSANVSKFFRNEHVRFIEACAEWNFSGPALIGCALLNAGGHAIGLRDVFEIKSQAQADRSHLILPQVWIENIESAKVDDVVKPILDVLWQSFDVERCPDYTEDGKWIGK